ncbi:MAG: peptidoglycan-binding protein [Streptosporangiaceae bacterium]
MSATGLATAVFIESPQQLAARSAPPPSTPISATARWQVLRDPITVQGAVRSARTVEVTPAAPFSTMIVTKMPVRAGDVVRPGRAVAEVDGRPVLLLRGRLPPYRDLREGDQGPDVTQLQRALASLGYAIFDPRGYFGPSTSFAVLLFYQHLGYSAPLYHPPKTPADPEPVPSAYLPMSEVVFIPAKSALVVAIGARTGRPAGAGPLVTLTTGPPYVTGSLTAHQAALARPGMAARIVSAIPPVTARGTVTRIGPLPAVGGAPPGGFPVLVRSQRRLPQHLVGASVRLTIEAPVTASPVLTVPAAAIIAGRPGQPARVIKLSGGPRAAVAVRTGPSAAGLVAVQSVRPGALGPGDHVLIGTSR